MFERFIIREAAKAIRQTSRRTFLYYGVALLVVGLIGAAGYLHHAQAKRYERVHTILSKGKRLESRNRFDEAAELYKEGIQLAPDNPELHFRLGECAIWTNTWVDIGKCFQRVLDLQPSNVKAAVYLAKYHRHETKDLDKCRTILLKALEYEPRHAPALDLLGTVEYERGELEASRDAYEKAIECSPGRVPAYQGLGRTLMRMNELEDARDVLQKALKVDSDNASTHYSLGQVLIRLGERDKGREHITRFKEIEEQSTDIKDLKTLTHRDPDNPAAWYRLGIAYLKQKDEKSAIRQFTECVSVDPTFGPAHSVLAGLLLRAKKPRAALGHVRAALEADSDSPRDWNNLGVCYMFTDKYEEAHGAFSKALQLDPGNEQFLRNLQTAREKANSSN